MGFIEFSSQFLQEALLLSLGSTWGASHVQSLTERRGRPLWFVCSIWEGGLWNLSAALDATQHKWRVGEVLNLQTPLRPIHTKRQRQGNSSVHWEKSSRLWFLFESASVWESCHQCHPQVKVMSLCILSVALHWCWCLVWTDLYIFPV